MHKQIVTLKNPTKSTIEILASTAISTDKTLSPKKQGDDMTSEERESSIIIPSSPPNELKGKQKSVEVKSEEVTPIGKKLAQSAEQNNSEDSPHKLHILPKKEENSMEAGQVLKGTSGTQSQEIGKNQNDSSNLASLKQSAPVILSGSSKLVVPSSPLLNESPQLGKKDSFDMKAKALLERNKSVLGMGWIEIKVKQAKNLASYDSNGASVNEKKESFIFH